MKRRSLLKLAGTAAGAALLSPFFARLGRAGPLPSARFVFFVEGNGYEPVTVLSPSARTQLDLSMAAPVGESRYWSRRYRHTSVIETSGDLDQAIALDGLGPLAAKTAVLLGLSSKITGGGHSAWHGVLSSRRSAGGVPTGETIDAHLDAVRVGYCSHHHHPGKNLDYGTCALGPGLSAPLVLQPQSSFDMLFGPATNRPQFDRDGRILDFAREDVSRSLAAFSSSSPERAKLEQYLAAIEANLTRRDRLAAAVPGLTTLPARPGARFAEDLYPVLAAQTSTLSVALQGGLTNVAVLGIGTGADFDTFYDATHAPRHNSHHESESNDAIRDYLHAQSRLQITTMIELARTLDAVPEEGGTLLDHTVLVYVGDNGETHHATGDEFPVVIMGGGALGLRTGGRSLVYPGLDQAGAGHRQVSNLWNTLGYLAGAELDAFGGESLRAGTRSAEGPLSELM
jgi:hypothetical protein